MKRTNPKHSKKTKQQFAVVGIGASAGGLEAIIKVVKAIPQDSGLAYIILLHPASDHPDSLAPILALHSRIPVQEIINHIDLTPDHIYTIPENNNLITQDGILKLHQRTRSESKTASIDIFFESLAEVYQSFAIGVILSGTAFEGTFGFKKIKEAGGTTLVQEPETAEFKGMPQSAIDADSVDYVLEPELIPEQLVAIQKSYTKNHVFTNDAHLEKNEQEILLQIINLIFLRTGNDFSHYTQQTIRKSIARRMIMNRKENLQDYYNHLRNDTSEQELLFNDFLIPVTYFFRDKNFFEALPRLVFPQFVENTVDNNLRIWVAGCSTGEEAYSLAITLHEYLSEKNSTLKVQIFASDVSEKCIAKARTAIYSAQDVQHISQNRLEHYFTKIDGNYHINKVIRDRCIFAVHNFIKDPPFTRINLISCRNVLIYLDSFLQNKVLRSFHYSLKDKGILFLGKSENIANAAQLFTTVAKPEKIFVRQPLPENNLPDALKSDHTDQKIEIPDKKKSQEEQITALKKALAQANERLEKTNLELKMATEQLQSNDTELLCLNEELVDRQEQLISLRDYAESIINTIREPLLIIDPDFFIKSANPAFYTYFETTQKETEGHSFFEIGDCQWDIPEFKELLFKLLVEKDIVEDFKIDTICTGLGKKIMMVNARRIINTQSPGIILLAIEDITDLVTTNNVLTKKQLELKKYKEELATFSTGASLDLQEPLRKILMFSERITDNEKNLTESSLHNLERIRIASSNMSHLVHNLIDYSKINFTKTEFKKIDLNVLLKKILSDLKEPILEKNALITVSALPQVNGISSQIQQLFINLITNAIRYTKEDVVPVIKIESQQPSREEIRSIGGDPEVKYAKICVTDNGIGFSKEYEYKIFDPFYRLHSNDVYKGSGLGLTIAKKIISNHNGFITASGRLNHGALFSVYIPL